MSWTISNVSAPGIPGSVHVIKILSTANLVIKKILTNFHYLLGLGEPVITDVRVLTSRLTILPPPAYSKGREVNTGKHYY